MSTDKLEEDMLLGEETTPPEALQPADLKLQIEKLQGCMERALQKVFTKQEEIERHVKTISDNLQGKRKTPAEEVRDGRSSKKAKQSCPKCQGDHPDLRCRLIPTEERIGMAVRRGICINCNGAHDGHCNREPACRKCPKPHLTCYHI